MQKFIVLLLAVIVHLSAPEHLMIICRGHSQDFLFQVHVKYGLG